MTKKPDVMAEALFFQTPTWRVDLHREEDLIEEVARLTGYDELPALMPPGPAEVWTGSVPFDPEDESREALVAEGFLEAISLAFQREDAAGVFGFDPKQSVLLANPLGEGRGLMRMSLLPALMRAARHNQDQLPSITDLRLFEIGRTFRWVNARPGDLPEQPRRVGLLMRGRRHPSGWFDAAGPMLDAFDLKAAVEAVLQAFSVGQVEWTPVERSWLHPRSATGLRAAGRAIGELGEAHPDLMDHYGLEGAPVFLAELDLEGLNSIRGPRPAFRPLPRHPPSQRDLSFFVDRAVPAADILAAMQGASLNVPLEDLALFDVYEGQGVPDGKKSLAVKMTFRAGDRTLTEQDVEGAQSSIIDALKDRFDVQIRDG